MEIQKLAGRKRDSRTAPGSKVIEQEGTRLKREKTPLIPNQRAGWIPQELLAIVPAMPATGAQFEG